MKKCVFMLAVVVGVLLSLCASAWATSYMLSNTVGGYTIKYNVSSSGSTFKIPVQAQVAISGKTNLTGYVEGVDGVKIEYTASPAASFEGLKIAKDREGADAADGSITISISDTSPETYPYNAYLIGTAKGNGTITVKSSLMSGTTVKQASNTTATITFSTSQGDDIVDPNFMSDGPNEDVPTVRPSPVTGTPGDPTSEKWNGLDPTFGAKGGNAKKDKPKVSTSKLVFNGTGGSAGKYNAQSKALISGASADFTVEITGPSPLINVYVSGSDAKKLWPLSCDKKLSGQAADWDKNNHIVLTSDNIKNWHIPFRVTVASLDQSLPASQDKNTKHTLKIAYNGAEVAYKGFPITIALENNDTGTKPVTKTFKIDITSGRQVPQWVTAMGVVGEKLTKKNAQEISVPLASGGNVGTVIYTVSADGPYYITSKGDKMGVSADVHQPELNMFGEVTTAGYVRLYGKFDDGDKGTKDGTKESKVAFTLDAVGNVKKTSFKPTVIGKVAPYFDLKDFVTSKDNSYAGLPIDDIDDFEDGIYYKAKTAEAGKVPSVAFKAKGSKTITYSISDANLAALNAVGLSFDNKGGKVVKLASASTTKATSEDGEYAPIGITVTATNSAGSSLPAPALVGVTGQKAKVFLGKDSDNKEIKNLVIPVNAAADTLFTIGAKVGSATDMAKSNDKTVNVQFRLANAKNAKEGREDTGIGEDTYALESLGLEFIPSSEFEDQDDVDDEAPPFKDAYRNFGVIRATGEQTATKGTKVNLIVSNLGNEQKGSVNIVIVDPKPVIMDADTDKDSSDVVLSNGQAVTVNLTLKEGAPSNSAKIKWAIKDKLSGSEKSNIKVKLTADGDDVSKAKVEVTAKSGKVKTAVTDKLTITATNSESKLVSDTFEIRVHSGDAYVTGASLTLTSPKQGGASAGNAAPATEDLIKYDDDADDEAEDEAKVVFGAPRTVANLTAGQMSFINGKGYTIIAVLPEVTADKDGQVEIPVELDEDAPEGAKMVYLPFAKDGGAEDDEIVDFYDEAGAPIEEVPAGKTITAAPWLRAGVTYEPVIAVESK